MNFAMSLFQSFRPAPLTPFIMPIFVLLILGFGLWLIFHYIPIEQPFKAIIIAVVVLCLVWWLFESFGILH